jgi:putative ribosome biogenesis GTPase RsgA
VKTKNVDSIKKVLKTNYCVTVFGKSGMGKSATIHHIALHYQNLVHNMHFWNNLHQVGSKPQYTKAK